MSLRPKFWTYYSWNNFVRVKPIALVMKDVAESAEMDHQPLLPSVNNVVTDGDAAIGAAVVSAPKRRLGVFDLVFFGVGSTVGAGIFSLIGPGLKQAGPGLVLSFLAGAISCVFTGLAYSEFAARLPVAGSAYTYAYTSFGEMLGWLIGWNLTLEYAIGAAAVARSWSQYFVAMLEGFHVHVPVELYKWDLGFVHACPLAAVIVLICTAVMLVGAKESAQFNSVVTVINVAILVFVVILGSTKIDTYNYTHFSNVPDKQPQGFVPHGAGSILSAAGTVFFSYLGFDMVSSMAEEVAKPQRDLPIGIVGSLAIAATLYMAVTLVVSGMYDCTVTSQQNAPLSFVFDKTHLTWATYIINVGSVFGLTASTFTGLMGQPRIFYRMAVDGLLFKFFGTLNTKGVPFYGCLVTGVITSLIGFFVGLTDLADAISIGTLCAFSVVDAGIIVQRRKDAHDSRRVIVAVGMFFLSTFVATLAFHQDWSIAVPVVFGVAAVGSVVYMYRLPEIDVPTTFKCPLVPLVPCAGIAINMSMMTGLGIAAWIRLLVWTLLGAAIYLFYGVQHSILNDLEPSVSHRMPSGAGDLGDALLEKEDDFGELKHRKRST